jgi:hypothetical protein
MMTTDAPLQAAAVFGALAFGTSLVRRYASVRPTRADRVVVPVVAALAACGWTIAQSAITARLGLAHAPLTHAAVACGGVAVAVVAHALARSIDTRWLLAARSIALLVAASATCAAIAATAGTGRRELVVAAALVATAGAAWSARVPQRLRQRQATYRELRAAATLCQTRTRAPVVHEDGLDHMTRRIRTEAVTSTDILDVVGPGATRTPIRVAIPFRAAPSPAARVELAMAELDRADAWSRRFLHVHSPAVGYAFSTHLASLELLARGDVATVVVPWGERSYYASIHRMADGERTQRLLHEAIRSRIDALSPGTRAPLVVVSAGSAGSKASQDVLLRGGAMCLDDHRVHVAIYTGCPSHSRNRTRVLARARATGSTDVREYRTLGELRRTSPDERRAARVRLLSHYDDWARSTPLDALAPIDVPAASRAESNVEPFLPLVSLLRQFQDLKNVDRKIPGSFSPLGHEYEPEIPWLFGDLFPELDDAVVERVVDYNRRATLERWGAAERVAVPTPERDPRPQRDGVRARSMRVAPLGSTDDRVGGPNMHGRFPVCVLGGDDPEVRGMRVVVKPVHAQAHQEVFAATVAHELGLAHLVPQAVSRVDGSAAMTWRPGHPFLTARIWSSRGLERALLQCRRRSHPAETVERSRAAALLDRQLLQVFDYVLGNSDRSLMNGLFDRAGAVLSLIDHGDIGRGEADDPLVPGLLSVFQPAPEGCRIVVDDAVRSAVARTGFDDRVRAAHADLQLASPPLPAGLQYWLERVQSDDYLERVLARIEQVVDRGWYRYGAVPAVPVGIPGVAPLTRRRNVRMQSACVAHAVTERCFGRRADWTASSPPAMSMMRSDM